MYLGLQTALTALARPYNFGIKKLTVLRLAWFSVLRMRLSVSVSRRLLLSPCSRMLKSLSAQLSASIRLSSVLSPVFIRKVSLRLTGNLQLNPKAFVDIDSCRFEPLSMFGRCVTSGSSTAISTLAVRVWFSDHMRHSSHDSAPLVHLSEDVSSWSAQLLSPWVHCLDPGVPVSFFVNPHGALGLWDDAHAHVVLVQNPMPRLASVLLVTHHEWLVCPKPHIAVGLG